jgi:predicted ATP-grasp superfamily ATP-dependent carboligase
MPAERHGSLAIARTLGLWGAPVHGYGGGISAVRASRYLKRWFAGPGDDAQPAEVVGRLIEIAQTLGQRTVLIPTTDETALFVSRHSAALEPWYIFPQQPAETLAALCSKKRMHYLAKRAGVPTPESCFPGSRADLLRSLDTTRFPVMLKGIHGKFLQQRTNRRMYVVKTAEELIRLYDRLEDPGNPNLMVQEYIPGADDAVWMFNGYFDANARCLAGFTGRKLRQFPVHRGLTCMGLCQGNPAVEGISKTLLSAIGYRGAVDIDYLYDQRDGSYKVIDINPRVGATFRLFVDAHGMDVVRALYLDLTGQPRTASAGVEGRGWMVEDLDLASSLSYWIGGQLSPRDWMRSLRSVRELAYFDRRDPLPLIASWAEDAFRGTAALAAHVKRRISTRDSSRTLSTVSQ